MKAILICPSPDNGIPVLADSRPLVTLPFLGESFICYWLQHLATAKFKEVRIITTDSVKSLAEFTGGGSRWGLKVEIFHEVRELSIAEARKRYRPSEETDWPAEGSDVLVADHFPGVPGHKVFASYANWFKAMGLWLPQMATHKRVGFKEIEPGIWVGRRTKVDKSAKLVAPCWLGDNVRIGANALIGPMAFLEDQVVIDARTRVLNSWVGPETFVGTLTELKDSLAWGALLINWKTKSHTQIPDPFLMTSLADKKRVPGKKNAPRKSVVSSLARPFEAVISFAQKFQG